MTLPADDADDTLDPALAEYHLGLLLDSLPPVASPAKAEARRAAIRAAFRSMHPRNATEAMLAAEVIAAHHVIMDCYRVALRAETEPAEAARARNSAAATSRVRLANLRALDRQPTAPAVPRRSPPARRDRAPAAEPLLEPIPVHERAYVPRDRLGAPIPLWRWSDMSMTQRRAAFSDPTLVAVREAALAEEAALIAAQSGTDADGPAPPGDSGLTPPPAAPS